jgi:cyanophycinase
LLAVSCKFYTGILKASLALFLKRKAGMRKSKGYLIAIGGAENKGNEEDTGPFFNDDAILKTVVEIYQQQKPGKIGLLTTASSYPMDVFDTYSKAFEKLGVKDLEHFNIEQRDQAEGADVVNRLNTCSCLFISGGDQLKLSSIIGGTALFNELIKRYFEDGFIIAGTSAGAMVLSTFMIYGGDGAEANRKGKVEINIGLGFIDNIIIDTHFDARGRFNRLAQVVATQPEILGIGLAEDTGIIIKNGAEINIIGSGSVTILDGRHMHNTNIAAIKPGEPISLQHLVVHLLCNGDCYNIKTREM